MKWIADHSTVLFLVGTGIYALFMSGSYVWEWLDSPLQLPPQPPRDRDPK